MNNAWESGNIDLRLGNHEAQCCSVITITNIPSFCVGNAACVIKNLSVSLFNLYIGPRCLFSVTRRHGNWRWLKLDKKLTVYLELPVVFHFGIWDCGNASFARKKFPGVFHLGHKS